VSNNQRMFFRFNIAFVLSFVCLATPAWSDYEAGEGAYQRGDYATALRECRPLAEQGNHSAQFFLGVCYANGYGVPKNREMALHWYRLSSDQGNWLAQNDLGVMYQNGDGYYRIMMRPPVYIDWVLKKATWLPRAILPPCITKVEVYVRMYGRPLD